MPPNGITVLEHAIIRYKWTNGASVDAVAARVTPRRALWIFAGLGDVAGVRSLIAGDRKLTTEARLNRPDLMAMGSIFALPPNHEADDLEIMWEAFMIAGWNERWSAMDALLDAGLPVDHAPLGAPLLAMAIGNLFVPLAEYLLGRGADPLREWPSPVNGSARELARQHVRNNSRNEGVRRLLAIWGRRYGRGGAGGDGRKATVASAAG
ncbi:hypothetical protein BH11GEM1_BH11GEM1_21980 [soil metagenome]